MNVCLDLGPELQCYFCSYDEGECGDEIAGIPIKCQMEDPGSSHYGNACVVAHTGRFNKLNKYRIFISYLILFYSLFVFSTF